MRGSEAKSWLNGVITCDVALVSEERGALGLLLNKQGKIQSDLVLVEASGTVFLSTAPGLDTKIQGDLERMLVMEDAELSNQSAELAFVFLHGKRAAELARACQLKLGFGAVDPTGHGGAAMVAERARLGDVERELVLLGATPDDGRGWLELRLEGAWPEFGVDYTSDDNPHQASLDRRSVSWSKGCYLGQEVVCMQDMRGKVKRRVACLELDSTVAPAAGSSVISSANTAGTVSSAAVSAERHQVLALAMLSAPYFEPGTPVEVGGAQGRVISAATPVGAST
ncbi:MAG TPA: glycine cleavage T C-terminal barrel domain-containing protein [Polyangiaceae bacterium]|nr:glycine cleavage T C-terminal barrel domain-containing protein [Polyangiaceae bacterium]